MTCFHVRRRRINEIVDVETPYWFAISLKRRWSHLIANTSVSVNFAWHEFSPRQFRPRCIDCWAFSCGVCHIRLSTWLFNGLSSQWPAWCCDVGGEQRNASSTTRLTNAVLVDRSELSSVWMQKFAYPTLLILNFNSRWYWSNDRKTYLRPCCCRVE